AVRRLLHPLLPAAGGPAAGAADRAPVPLHRARADAHRAARRARRGGCARGPRDAPPPGGTLSVAPTGRSGRPVGGAGTPTVDATGRRYPETRAPAGADGGRSMRFRSVAVMALLTLLASPAFAQRDDIKACWIYIGPVGDFGYSYAQERRVGKQCKSRRSRYLEKKRLQYGDHE